MASVTHLPEAVHIPNFVNLPDVCDMLTVDSRVAAAFGAEYSPPHGCLVSIRCDGGSVRLQHDMTPAQARLMAEALLRHVEACEALNRDVAPIRIEESGVLA
jgi:hypothetical protein